MFTNQKVLGMLLIVFIIGTAIYFTVTKFSRDVSNLSVTPTPAPQDINFTLNSTPAPSAANVAQTQSTELPLAKNKRLDRFPGILRPEVLQNKKAVIQTSKGLIQLQIYPEASMAASNFMLLAANGFYDGLTFHRVEDWVVQGGDPTGTGSGGPGYQFPDEQIIRAYVKGIVAMANSGPNTNGSQFFILKKDSALQPNYTIFGQVISGQEVVDKIAVGEIMQRVLIQDLQ
ncbi:MAG: peptidylprolyl isomerase [Candidatus Daviesbacteria bacterium]|nr:peptidylprolyl isomerase [Candidatus Daviesbacteria bacterium]